MELLKCRNLSKRYGSNQALDQVSFSIQPGRIVGLLGPNGQGKSTLVKSIMNLIRPDSGEILLNNQPVGAASQLDIAYLPEHTYLETDLKIDEILHLFSTFYSNFNMDRARAMLDSLHKRTVQESQTSLSV